MPELELAVSATTRDQRSGEVNGREYWFITPEKFERLVEDGEFLSTSTYPGARVWDAAFRDRPHSGSRTCAAARPQTDGALRVQETIPGAVTVFVDAPTFEELERRLRERATESSGEIQVRLDLARSSRLKRALQLRDRERRCRARCGRADRNRPPRTSNRRYHEPPMIHPRIDELLDNVDSRYALVIVAAKRARQINDYHHQLGEGIGFDEAPPPLVESRARTTRPWPSRKFRGQAQVQVPEVVLFRPGRELCQKGRIPAWLECWSASPVGSPPTRPVNLCACLSKAGMRSFRSSCRRGPVRPRRHVLRARAAIAR